MICEDIQLLQRIYGLFTYAPRKVADQEIQQWSCTDRVGAKTAIGATALLRNNELLCPSDNEACATDGLSCS